MKEQHHWLALGYHIPVNPSKNRVYVWRKLKECGAEYFKQGVAVLPNTEENLAQFRELSFKVREMGGDASIVELKFVDENDEFDMIYRFKNQSDHDYQEILEELTTIETADKQVTGSAVQNTYEDVKRMIKKYSKVKSRDFFASGVAADLEHGFTQIIDTFKDSASDFGNQLRKTLEKHK